MAKKTNEEKLKEVSGGIGDVNTDATITTEVHNENSSKTVTAGNIGGNVSL